jgi:hypothetical protein
MARYRKKRKQKVFGKRGLILCEGESEENYFKGLITQDKYKRKFQAIDVNIFKPKDHSPVGLVNEAKNRIKEAKREKNAYDFVWVVFDKDGHAKIPEAFEIARKSTPEIKIAFSAPCFEFFILLHFEKTTKPFKKCDDVISQIHKKWFADYEKATNIFDQLLDKKTIGISNSKWLQEQVKVDIKNGTRVYELSAYTDIDKLVEYLYTLI